MTSRSAPSFPLVLQALLASALHPRHAAELRDAAWEYYGRCPSPSDPVAPTFVEWATFDRRLADGTTLVDAFLESSPPSRTRNRVRQWTRCRSRMYRVVKVEGATCLLADLLPNPPHESSFLPVICAIPGLAPGDILLGRVLPWQDARHLACTAHVFPAHGGDALPPLFQHLLRPLGRRAQDRLLRQLLPMLALSEAAGRPVHPSSTPWTGEVPPLVLEAALQHGLVYLARERWEEALASFEYVLAENPLDVEARNGVALAYLGCGRPDRARRALQSILSTHPGHPTALLNLGNLELCEGRVSRAVALLEEARLRARDGQTLRQATANLHVAMRGQPLEECLPCT